MNGCDRVNKVYYIQHFDFNESLLFLLIVEHVHCETFSCFYLLLLSCGLLMECRFRYFSQCKNTLNLEGVFFACPTLSRPPPLHISPVPACRVCRVFYVPEVIVLVKAAVNQLHTEFLSLSWHLYVCVKSQSGVQSCSSGRLVELSWVELHCRRGFPSMGPPAVVPEAKISSVSYEFNLKFHDGNKQVIKPTCSSHRTRDDGDNTAVKDLMMFDGFLRGKQSLPSFLS